MPMQFRMALSVSTLTLAVAGSTLWAGAQQRQPGDVIKLAAEALGGAGRLRADKNDRRRRLRRDRLHEWRRQHLGIRRRAAEVDQRARVREDASTSSTGGCAFGSATIRTSSSPGSAGYLGGANAATAYLDGDVAYNGGPNGRLVRANDQAARARRIDMMNNPVALVRAALDRPAAVEQLAHGVVVAARRHHARDRGEADAGHRPQARGCRRG